MIKEYVISLELWRLMRGKIKILLVGFIVLSLSGLIGIVLVNYHLKNTYRPFLKADGGVGLKVEDVRYFGTRDGRMEWELEADSATRFKGEDITVFDTVKMIFYPEDGSPYTFTGKKGRYSEKTGEIELSGDVVVVSSEDGYKLKTDVLRYLSDSGKVTTDSPVEIRFEDMGMKITGVGLVIEIKDGRFSVLKDVRTVVEDAFI